MSDDSCSKLINAYFPSCSPALGEWLIEFSETDFLAQRRNIIGHAGKTSVNLVPAASIITKLNLLHAYDVEALLPLFTEQATLQQHDNRYYEEFIVEDKAVPTRLENWHDLYNALVWQRFPRLKWAMSSLQYREIKRVGLHPRTSLRNYLTHLDECGIILAIPEHKQDTAQELLTALANHEWERAFITCRDQWYNSVYPLVLGHANLEMLMSPFAGLTGKWIAIAVSDDFSDLTQPQKYTQVDHKMAEFVLESSPDLPRLLPIPLLAIPSYLRDFNSTMLADKDYYRPLPHYRKQVDSVVVW